MIRFFQSILWLILCCLGASQATAEPAQEAGYVNPACGIRFSYPADWQVTKTNKMKLIRKNHRSKHYYKPKCALSVQPRNLAQLKKGNNGEDLYSIYIREWDGNLNNVPWSSGFKRKDDGSWVLLGRMGIETPAESTSSNPYESVRGFAETGCYNNNGYTGMCEIPRALVSYRKDILVSIEGSGESDAQFEQILKTLRFDSSDK